MPCRFPISAAAVLLAVFVFPGGWAGLPAAEEPPRALPELLPLPPVEDYAGPLANQLLPIGERLIYDIDWGLFHVATSELEIAPPKKVGGEPATHLIMVTRTNRFADAIFKIRDELHSYVSPDFKRSYYYTQRVSGSNEKDARVVFDWKAGVAQRTDWGKPWIENLPLTGDVLDPLGITFAFRIRQIGVGETLFISSTDGKTLLPVEIRILKREKVKTALGTFDCYLVVPETGQLKGVFEKSPEASIHIWFEVHPPYVLTKLKSKVAVGSFEAKLREISGPGAADFLARRLDPPSKKTSSSRR